MVCPSLDLDWKAPLIRLRSRETGKQRWPEVPRPRVGVGNHQARRYAIQRNSAPILRTWYLLDRTVPTPERNLRCAVGREGREVVDGKRGSDGRGASLGGRRSQEGCGAIGAY